MPEESEDRTSAAAAPTDFSLQSNVGALSSGNTHTHRCTEHTSGDSLTYSLWISQDQPISGWRGSSALSVGLTREALSPLCQIPKLIQGVQSVPFLGDIHVPKPESGSEWGKVSCLSPEVLVSSPFPLGSNTGASEPQLSVHRLLSPPAPGLRPAQPLMEKKAVPTWLPTSPPSVIQSWRRCPVSTPQVGVRCSWRISL